MNKAKAARMYRDLKLGFVGIGLDFTYNREKLLHKTIQIPKKYKDRSSMQQRVCRHFAQW